MVLCRLPGRCQARGLCTVADSHCVADTSLIRLAIGRGGTASAEKLAVARTDLRAPVPAHVFALHPFRTGPLASGRAPLRALISRVFRWGNFRGWEFLIGGAGCASRQCEQKNADSNAPQTRKSNVSITSSHRRTGHFSDGLSLIHGCNDCPRCLSCQPGRRQCARHADMLELALTQR